MTRMRAESPHERLLVQLLVRNRTLQTIPWEALCRCVPHVRRRVLSSFVDSRTFSRGCGAEFECCTTYASFGKRRGIFTYFVFAWRKTDPVRVWHGTENSGDNNTACGCRAPAIVVPYKKNPNFVGRDAESERLHELLQIDQAAGATVGAISGMGGIGETLIAAEYAHRYRDAYPDGVYWVNAAQDWQVEFGRLGTLSGCRAGEGPAGQEHARLAEAFALQLRARPRALVVFDNVDRPLALQDASLELIQARLECKVVMTTRRREWPSAEVLMAAKSICSLLDGHPLALALAGAYLDKHASISFAGYLEGLQTEGALSMMKGTRVDALSLATQHDGNVEATLIVQWNSIQAEGTRLAFQTAAVFSESNRISRDRLALLTGLSDAAQSWRESPLTEALREWSSLSLLEDLNSKEITLHRLVRELIEKQIPDRKAFAEFGFYRAIHRRYGRCP